MVSSYSSCAMIFCIDHICLIFLAGAVADVGAVVHVFEMYLFYRRVGFFLGHYLAFRLWP